MTVRLQMRAEWTGLARWVSHILLGAGGLMMAVVLWTLLDSALYQSVQERQFAAETRGPATSPSEPRITPTQNFLQPLFRLGRLDPLVIGRLDIPRLGLTAMVREGVEPVTLRRAIGHLPGSALPGESGNFVVAGHRDSFFRGLRLIQNGDEIRIKTSNGAFTYRVTALSVVDPSDTQSVQATTTPVCTLVTCFPFDFVGLAPRRYIVRAEMAP
jgi:sortase A